MPYKWQTDKTPMPRQADKRVKLTDRQRKQIRLNPDGLSQRKLAKLYGVSRRLITFILDPQKLADNREARDKRGGWEQYYKGGSEWAKTMRKHRRYKQEVLTGNGETQQTKGESEL
tara:strand:+ start:359 stop:706 length:348 start_codon:yes stop_codon:yes gene_type:complete